jgi:hypothetical protein
MSKEKPPAINDPVPQLDVAGSILVHAQARGPSIRRRAFPADGAAGRHHHAEVLVNIAITGATPKANGAQPEGVISCHRQWVE